MLRGQGVSFGEKDWPAFIVVLDGSDLVHSTIAMEALVMWSLKPRFKSRNGYTLSYLWLSRLVGETEAHRPAHLVANPVTGMIIIIYALVRIHRNTQLANQKMLDEYYSEQTK